MFSGGTPSPVVPVYKTICDEANPLFGNYPQSQKFPDCDDKPVSISYKDAADHQILVSESLWGFKTSAGSPTSPRGICENSGTKCEAGFAGRDCSFCEDSGTKCEAGFAGRDCSFCENTGTKCEAGYASRDCINPDSSVSNCVTQNCKVQNCISVKPVSTWDAWNVHPLTPITQTSCYYNYDFDCNKNDVDNLLVLLAGAAPFDMDTSTGREIIDVNSGLKGRDNICYSTNPNIQAWKELTSNVFYTAGFLGVGIAAAAMSPILAGGLAIYGAGMAAYDISTCIGAASVRLEGTGFWKWSDEQAPVYNCINGVGNLAIAGLGYKLAKAKVTPRSVKEVGKTPGTLETAGETKVAKTTPAVAGCFLANTSITLADGSIVPIQNIKSGDEVLAYDIYNKNPVNATVTATFIRNETDYLIIKYEAVD
jgi:hypothetical protein